MTARMFNCVVVAGVIYRPLNSSVSCLNELEEALQFRLLHYDYIPIVGDAHFNILDSVKCGIREFLNLVSCFNLSQLDSINRALR